MMQLYSDRNRAVNERPYVYGPISKRLREQILYILDRALGTEVCTPDRHGHRFGDERFRTFTWKSWTYIRDQLREHRGVRDLRQTTTWERVDARDECYEYFRGLSDHEVDAVLDFIDLGFRVVARVVPTLLKSDSDRRLAGLTCSPEKAVEDLNRRFDENHLGYRFTHGEHADLIRIDSEYTHAEITEPALTLLSGGGFEAPSQEFRAAHTAYLQGNNKEAIREAQNALESTLKITCDAHGWKYGLKDGLSKLVDLVLTKGLIPTQVQEQLTTLAASLRSIGTIRNNTPGVGHGQGAEVVEVPRALAGYVLHLTAAAMVLLVTYHRDSQGH